MIISKKVKKRNLRKSESDVRRLGRGSSSGSNSTRRSDITPRVGGEEEEEEEALSDQEILIEKDSLKQVRVLNLKGKGRDVIPELDEGSAKVRLTKSLDEQQLVVVHHAPSKKKVAKEVLVVHEEVVEEEEDDEEEEHQDHHPRNVKLSKSKPTQRESGTSPIQIPPSTQVLRKGRSHSSLMDDVVPEEEQDHHERDEQQQQQRRDHHQPDPKYYVPTASKPMLASPNPQRYYQTQERLKRLSSPFLQTTQNRIRLHLSGSAKRPGRRPGGPKEGSTAQRVASAKRMTIMDLKSKIQLLQDEIEKLKKENRFLNHLHHRQDNALKKWEGKDAELPRLLNQHKDEIRTLQQQLRKSQSQSRDTTEKLSMRDKKIFRLEAELDKLRTLAQEEDLQDRHQLQEELNIAKMNLSGAEKRIKEYMKHVDVLEKNHRHQLTTQERKLIKVNNNTYELQQVVANLRLALRNKDRMLNYIQMRSSGRNLIRAFHAEKVGIQDVLYGTGVVTTINRPYPPGIEQTSSMAVSQKLESITSTTVASECCGNSMQEQFHDGASQFSNSNTVTNTSVRPSEVSTVQRGNNGNEMVVSYTNPTPRMEDHHVGMASQRPLSRQSKSLDSIVRVPNQVQPTLEDNMRREEFSQSGASFRSKSPAPSSIVSSVPQVQSQRNIPGKAPGDGIGISVDHRKIGEINHHHQPPRQDNSSKPPKVPIPAPQRSVGKQGPGSTTTSHRSMDSGKGGNNHKVTPKPLPVKNIYKNNHPGKVKVNKSRELVYRASPTGFKYEGPFVKDHQRRREEPEEEETEELLDQQSAEILYSVKSDHHQASSLGDQRGSLSASLSSSGSSGSSSASFTEDESQPGGSSHRSELLSNIDILSARIRESCVLVPPPEESLKSPRNSSIDNKSYSSRQDGSQAMTSNLYFDETKPPVGPCGDGSSSPSSFMHHQGGPPILTPDNFHTLEYQQQSTTGLLQIMQQSSGDSSVQQQPPSPRSNNPPPPTYLLTSPRGSEQLQTISFIQVNDHHPSGTGSPQLASPRSQQQSSQQPSQAPAQQSMTSYSMTPSQPPYPSYSAVNFLTESQQQHFTPDPTFPTFPPDYFLPSSYGHTTTQERQHPILQQSSSQLAVLQPSSGYEPILHHSSSSPGFSQQVGTGSSFYTPTPIATSKSSSYFNHPSSVSNGGSGDQQGPPGSSLPSINSSSGSASKPSYNPSYYANLNSWN